VLKISIENHKKMADGNLQPNFSSSATKKRCIVTQHSSFLYCFSYYSTPLVQSMPAENIIFMVGISMKKSS
jgi:hypothetical protein